jgi:hypothetical protein
MDAVTFAKGQIEHAFSILNTIATGMTDEQYNMSPGGTANTPAKSHVHALTAMDFFVNGIIRGGEIEWKTFGPANGLPANPMEIWAFSGTVQLAPMSDYSAKVKAAVLEYVGSLKDSDLDREIETQFFGKQTAAWIIQLGVVHLTGHAGDIAAVKGIQGLKGLPF